MTFASALAGLAFVLSSPLAFACGEGRTDTDRTASLVAQITAKFGLRAEHVEYRCGGSAFEFSFQPAERIVAEDSRMNERLYLGGIGGTAAASQLERLLQLTQEQMSALKAARIAFMRDQVQAQNLYGIRAYEPRALPLADRVSQQGMLLYVTAPLCDQGFSSAYPLGTMRVPAMSLDAAAADAIGTLYKSGDLIKALRGSAEIRRVGSTVAQANKAANSMYCNRGINGNQIDWQRTIDVLSTRGR